MKEQRQKAILAVLLVVWAAVAWWVWSSFQPPVPRATTAPAATEEIAYFLEEEEGATVDLYLEMLDDPMAPPAPARDLFSSAPVGTLAAGGGPGQATGAADTTAAEAPPQPPPIAAGLRYLGYVETASGTLALLREGSQMYLASAGNRVGPGYLVTTVDATFVEIEFKGTRIRLPVSGQGSTTNGQ